MIEILPSVLAADFTRLGDEVSALEEAGCRMLHVDIMDGHFVPNLSMGPAIVSALRGKTRMLLDVHLMISDPNQYAPAFIDAGADLVSVHQEACPHLDRTLNLIREHGAKAGVVVNPSTPVSTLDDVLETADYVLIMSVNPGFGGQKFIPNALRKVRELASRRKERKLQFPIEIDGGITLDNVTDAVNAGVEWVVAGTSIFHTVNPGDSFVKMRHAAQEALTIKV